MSYQLNKISFTKSLMGNQSLTNKQNTILVNCNESVKEKKVS